MSEEFDEFLNSIGNEPKTKMSKEKTAKEFINKLKPKMVENWSNQASLLSYGQVAELMDMWLEYNTKTKKR